MKKALIYGTRIVQVEDAEFPVAAPLFWHTVPDDTTPRDTVVDGVVVKESPPPPPTPEEIAAVASMLAKAKLAEIDLRSIRAIREYLAAKPDAPQVLKDREAEAVAERAKLK